MRVRRGGHEPPPVGEQFEITAGDHRATIVEVGAGLRAYRVGVRPVVWGYGADAMCAGARGALLIPWPNRLEDGRYRFEGEEHQLALSEPAHGNAIHGLVRWRSFRAIAREADWIVMALRLHPTPGYPFLLDLTVEYRVDVHGLTVCTTARNSGARPLPFGMGQHPYLAAGDAHLDECTLELRRRDPHPHRRGAAAPGGARGRPGQRGSTSGKASASVRSGSMTPSPISRETPTVSRGPISRHATDGRACGWTSASRTCSSTRATP